MNPLRRLFGRKNIDLQQSSEGCGPPSVGSDRHMTLKVETDGLEQEAQCAVWDKISKTSDIPVFSGKVEHGYSRQALSQTDLCPRCQAKTEQKYAHFIYATNIETLVMFAPAGFFCPRCPTVIIDEEIIARGVRKEFRFQGVVGLDDPREKKPNPFDTWNGKKVVYVFDEDEHIVGLRTIDSLRDRSTTLRKSTNALMKARHKRQMAKISRRRNRR